MFGRMQKETNAERDRNGNFPRVYLFNEGQEGGIHCFYITRDMPLMVVADVIKTVFDSGGRKTERKNEEREREEGEMVVYIPKKSD